MIQIAGLSPTQMQIADLVWHCNTREELDTLRNAMPSEAHKQTTDLMIELIMIESIDQATGKETAFPEVADYLQLFNNQ